MPHQGAERSPQDAQASGFLPSSSLLEPPRPAPRANRMAPALPFTLRDPGVSSPPGLGSCLALPKSHLAHRQSMGPPGHAPKEPTPSSQITRYLHPRILCPDSPKLTPRVYTGLSQEFSPQPTTLLPGGGGLSSSWGGQRSDMGLEYPHMCTHLAHCAGQSRRAEEKGRARALFKKQGKCSAESTQI